MVMTIGLLQISNRQLLEEVQSVFTSRRILVSDFKHFFCASSAYMHVNHQQPKTLETNRILIEQGFMTIQEPEYS